MGEWHKLQAGREDHNLICESFLSNNVKCPLLYVISDFMGPFLAFTLTLMVWNCVVGWAIIVHIITDMCWNIPQKSL